MTAMRHDELLGRLGACLLADPAAPDADERAALHRALEHSPTPSVPSRPTGRQWRRFRRPVAATIAATIVLSGGAAAAVETNTLPGPLRSLAVTLGLPVAPTALTQAQNALSDLARALTARDPVAVRTDLASLEAALPQLSPSDRADLGPGLADVIAQAQIFLAAQSDQEASRASRNGDGLDRTHATGDATAPAGRSGGDDPEGANDSGGQDSGSPPISGPGTPTAPGPTGTSDGDDVRGGSVSGGTSPGTTTDGGTSSGGSDGGTTTTAPTSPDGSGGSGSPDGSTSSDGGSDGSSGSAGPDSSLGTDGGSDDGGSVS